MTCIVGIKSERGVLIGGDTQGSGGWNQRDRMDDKVFLLGKHRRVAVGFTSSYRMGQILRFHLTLPDLDSDLDPYEWAVTRFVPAAREALKAHGYVKIENSREESGTFLLAVRDRLFSVHDDFQVAEVAAPYNACGCGEEYAMGALHAVEKMKGAPRWKLRVALEAAARWSNGVGSRVTFVETVA
jgi:ATP-dependent protease HslVU (ClpYQ) peptidase subunit